MKLDGKNGSRTKEEFVLASVQFCTLEQGDLGATMKDIYKDIDDLSRAETGIILDQLIQKGKVIPRFVSIYGERHRWRYYYNA